MNGGHHTDQQDGDAPELSATTGGMATGGPHAGTLASTVNTGGSFAATVNGQLASLHGLTTAQKKRTLMLQRADRLRDPKIRQMGIDVQALDEQVREREALHEIEKDRNDYFDRQALLMSKHAMTLQDEVNQIRVQRGRQMNDYRNTFQKRHMRREWDLNDPQYITKDIPARVGDDDPRNGISSLQKFQGEDLDKRNRVRAQQEQLQRWADQQTEEKIAKKWMEQDANRAFEDRREETNYRLYQVEQAVAEHRKQMNINTAEFNKALSEQKRREALRNKESEVQKNLEEIDFCLNGDFLNETETVMSKLGTVTKSERYKGMSAEELRGIHMDQEEQRQNNRRRQMQEAEDERQWAASENMQLRMANALERQRDRERRAERLAIQAENKRQAGEASETRKRLNELYQNDIGENYYKHWNLCL